MAAYKHPNDDRSTAPEDEDDDQDLPPETPPSFIKSSGSERFIQASQTNPLSVTDQKDEFFNQPTVYTKLVKERNEKTGEKTINGMYKKISNIGEGAYGKVKLAQRVDTGEFVAMKKMSRKRMKRIRYYKKVDGRMVMTSALDKVQDEIRIHGSINHPNVPRVQAIIDDPSQDAMYIVMEYCKFKCLMDYDGEIQRFRSGVFPKAKNGIPEEKAKPIFNDMVKGLQFLRSRRIIHRDIKPQNILVTEDYGVKICDFGEAKSLGPGEDEMLSDTKGTPYFYSPEACSEGKYDGFKADIWALGVTLFAALTAVPAFLDPPGDAGGEHVLFEIIRAQPLTFPKSPSLSPEAQDLLKKMLEKDPAKRISLEDIQTHPWLSTPTMPKQSLKEKLLALF